MKRTQTVPIDGFRQYIAEDFFKVRNYRIFPMYFIFMVMLLSLLLWNRSHNNSSQATFYIMEAARHQFHTSKFQQIVSVGEFYDWLDVAITAAYSTVGNEATGVAAPVEPIGFLLVRQQRAASARCGSSTLQLPDNVTAFMSWSNFSCRSLEVTATDTQPYGDPQRPWLANRVLQDERIPDPGPLVGRLFAFDAPKQEQFSIKFFYNLSDVPGVPNATLPAGLIGSAAAGKAELDRMRKFSWLDEQTVIVSVDVITFMPIAEYFTHITMLAEFASSGFVVPTVHGIVFKVENFGSNKANFSFFVDLLTLFCAIGLTLEWVLLIKVKYQFGQSLRKIVIEFWIIVTLAIIAIFWVVFVWRMQLWAYSNRNATPGLYDGKDVDVSSTAMFNGLAWAGRITQDSYMLLSIALIFYASKLLMYVQYVSGINLVSETIRRSVRDIVGVGLIAVLLLMTFATAGTVFFGTHAAEFATWSIAFVSLTRMLVASDLVVYDDLSLFAPRVTAVYFTAFYFFLGLITLNLVLGIIVTGFASSKRASLTKLKDKEFETAFVVFRRYFLMKGMEFKDEKHLSLKYRGKPMSTSIAAASAALRMQISFRQRLERLNQFYEARYLAVIELDRLIARGETTIYRDNLDSVLPMMAPNLHIHLFDIYFAKLSNKTQTVGDTAANDDEVAYKLACIQQNIERANAKIRGDVSSLENGDRILDTDEEEESGAAVGADSGLGTIQSALRSPTGVSPGGAGGGDLGEGLDSHASGVAGLTASMSAKTSPGLRRTGRLIVRRNGARLSLSESNRSSGFASLLRPSSKAKENASGFGGTFGSD